MYIPRDEKRKVQEILNFTNDEFDKLMLDYMFPLKKIYEKIEDGTIEVISLELTSNMYGEFLFLNFVYNKQLMFRTYGLGIHSEKNRKYYNFKCNDCQIDYQIKLNQKFLNKTNVINQLKETEKELREIKLPEDDIYNKKYRFLASITDDDYALCNSDEVDELFQEG